MSDDILNNETTRLSSEVVYQRDSELSESLPEFKPGKTPHTQYGNQILNGNIPWPEIIEEIQAHYTQERLVKETGVSPATLRKISQGNYDRLDFRTGAKILGVHCLFYPEQY
jgi:hypothetical protein